MSQIQRVQNVFIGDGTAMPAAGSVVSSTNVLTGDLAIGNTEMEVMAAGDTVANTDGIFVVEGRTSTTAPTKRSMKIPGKKVTSYLGKSYKPASRDVWAIGYNRQTSAGSIDVTSDSDYQFYLRFKNSKQLFSERALRRSFTFRSATSATQLSIATQIAAAINADIISADFCTAVVVADGTGAYGLTGATNYGVEITSKVLAINQTSYLEERVYFEVHLEDFATSFGSTTATQIENMTYGSGTYNQVYLIEKRCLSNEGVLNFTKWPIPTQIMAASSTLATSSNVSGTTGNVTVTINLDRGSVATANTILRPGEIIDVNGVQYEIKYLISTTEFVLTTVASATYTGANLKVKYGYDTIAIEFSNPNLLDGAGMLQDNLQSVVIAIPAITAAAAYNSQSTQLGDVLGILNPYMQSVGFATLNL